MTDDEKMDAVDGLLALYGSWIEMSRALLGHEGLHGAELAGEKWVRYHALRREYAVKYSVEVDRKGYMIGRDTDKWPRIWKPAFWDAVTKDCKP